LFYVVSIHDLSTLVIVLRPVTEMPTPSSCKQTDLVRVGRLFAAKPTLSAWRRQVNSQEALLNQVRALLPADMKPHCTDIKVQGEALTLFVDSPSWATRIRYQSVSLAKMTGYSKITISVYRPAPPPKNKYKTVGYKARILSEKACEVLRQSACQISDPTLKQALIRLARHRPQ
jgi:hypothetical protein